MRMAALLLIPLLAACGGGEGTGTAVLNGDGDAASPRPSADVQTEQLTGLYEAASTAGQSAQMCMISDPSGAAAFGIVTRNSNAGNCGGAGQAVRQGNMLRLTMTGDEECLIQAQIDGTRVTFPSALPQSCSYYCGSGASLAGMTFDKTGGTTADAKRATDLAGDPLCS